MILSGKKPIFSAKSNKNEQTCINSADTDRPNREKHYFSNLNIKYSKPNEISRLKKYRQCDRTVYSPGAHVTNPMQELH